MSRLRIRERLREAGRHYVIILAGNVPRTTYNQRNLAYNLCQGPALHVGKKEKEKEGKGT